MYPEDLKWWGNVGKNIHIIPRGQTMSGLSKKKREKCKLNIFEILPIYKLQVMHGRHHL